MTDDEAIAKAMSVLPRMYYTIAPLYVPSETPFEPYTYYEVRLWHHPLDIGKDPWKWNEREYIDRHRVATKTDGWVWVRQNYPDAKDWDDLGR